MIKTVIFDMDGVIVDSLKEHFDGWDHAMKLQGIKYPRELDEKLNGMTLSDSVKLIEKETKQKVDKKKALIDKNNYIDPLYPDFKLFPGVIELLDELRESKYNIALASSSQRSHIEIVLKNNKISDKFDFVISGLDVEKSKPNPEIFLRCAKNFNSQPDECIVIEDALNGVIAAKRAGMHCIAVLSSTKKELLGEADIIVRSIKDIKLELIKDFD